MPDSNIIIIFFTRFAEKRMVKREKRLLKFCASEKKKLAKTRRERERLIIMYKSSPR